MMRGVRAVDKNGVHLVDDGEVVAALHLCFLGAGHAVVTQVVETEFGVGAVGDVAVVLLAAQLAGHHALDAAHGEPQVGEERAHPHGVALGQVVVHRHHVHAEPGEGVQVHRQGGDKGLAFTRGHFRDEAAVQRNAAEQLHIKVHHVPGDGRAADIHGLADHVAGTALDDGESLREDGFQVLGANLGKLGFNLLPDLLALLDGFHGGLDGGELGEFLGKAAEAVVEGICALLQLLCRGGEQVVAGGQLQRGEAVQVLLPLAGLGGQEILVLGAPRLLDGENFLDDGPELAHLALVLGTHDFIENPLDHDGERLR